MTHFKGRDIVSIDQFTTAEIAYLIKKAEEFKKNPKEMQGALKGKALAFAFFESSTRTRTSFLKAAQNLGMDRNGFGSAESSSLSKGESLGDTLRVLADYGHDVLVLRHRQEGAAQYIADKLPIPVINAGDGRHEHPTQALLDLFAIQETQGRLDKLKVAFVGDLKYGRTVHSLLKALRRFPDNEFHLVHPAGLGLSEDYTHIDDGHRKKMAPDIHPHIALEQALKECDIIYMTRTQRERMSDEEKERSPPPIILKPDMMAGAKKNLKVLHPMPIDANHGEIDKTFARLQPGFAYFFQQAANGIPVREALLAAVLGKIGTEFEGESYKRPQYANTDALVEVKRESIKQEQNALDSVTEFQLSQLTADQLRDVIKRAQKEKGEQRIMPVHSGTVVDHIPDLMAVRIYNALHLGDETKYTRGRTRIAEGAHSESMKSKDILMVDGRALTADECRIIAMLAPGVTINIVEQGQVVRKYKTQLPGKIEGVLQCSNDSCISRDSKEDAQSIFYLTRRSPQAELSCHYCDKPHGYKRGNLVTLK